MQGVMLPLGTPRPFLGALATVVVVVVVVVSLVAFVVVAVVAVVVVVVAGGDVACVMMWDNRSGDAAIFVNGSTSGISGDCPSLAGDCLSGGLWPSGQRVLLLG